MHAGGKILVREGDTQIASTSIRKGDAMKTLGDAKVGESSTIVKLHGEGALRRHLMDLGLIKGTSFKVVKVHRWATLSRSTFAATSCLSARRRRLSSRFSKFT